MNVLTTRARMEQHVPTHKEITSVPAQTALKGKIATKVNPKTSFKDEFQSVLRNLGCNVYRSPHEGMFTSKTKNSATNLPFSS